MLREIARGELDEINAREFSVDEDGNVILTLDITIKSEFPILHQTVLDLQRQIGSQLQEEGILDQVALDRHRD